MRQVLDMDRTKCRSCDFSSVVDFGADGRMLRACLYILATGRRRPCAPGKGCTVYRPKGKKQWFQI